MLFEKIFNWNLINLGPFQWIDSQSTIVTYFTLTFWLAFVTTVIFIIIRTARHNDRTYISTTDIEKIGTQLKFTITAEELYKHNKKYFLKFFINYLIMLCVDFVFFLLLMLFANLGFITFVIGGIIAIIILGIKESIWVNGIDVQISAKIIEKIILKKYDEKYNEILFYDKIIVSSFNLNKHGQNNI